MKRVTALIFIVAIVPLAIGVEWWVAVAMLSITAYASLILIDAIMFRGDVYTTAVQPLIISALMQLVPWVIFPFVVTDFSHWPATLLAIASGAVGILGYWLYFHAMEDDQDAVVISIIWNLMIALVPVMAYVFIGEELGLVQYVGIGLIFTGALVATFQKAKAKGKVVAMMVGAVTMLSLSVVGMKEVYNLLEAAGNESVYWSGYLPRALGCGLVGLFFLTGTLRKQQSRVEFVSLVKVFWPVFLLTEALQISADMLTSLATTGGPISVVIAMDGLLGMFTAGLAVLVVFALMCNKVRFGLRRAALRFRNEQFEHFGLKVSGMALITIGAYLAT
ncbi:MAG: EamA family transporter [Candidatus Pacebacteria bacterium]|jgi:uncharacterized membrane protein|nr:EamA family transporter [Candidatus Paceibacterota bacterium]